MDERPQSYLSYLLRMWREERDREIIWRASLESAQTRERWHFATVDEMIEFIYACIREPMDAGALFRDD